MEPSPHIIPRFDLDRAIVLLRQGRSPSKVIAAAERLGDNQLKHDINMYISWVRSVKHLLQSELGIVWRGASRVERRAVPPL